MCCRTLYRSLHSHTRVSYYCYQTDILCPIFLCIKYFTNSSKVEPRTLSVRIKDTYNNRVYAIYSHYDSGWC